MPGKHAPDSPRSFYVSLARAIGAALGAVGLMVAAVLVLLSRGSGTDKSGLPIVSSPRPSVSSRAPTPKGTPTHARVTTSPSPSPSGSPAATVTVGVYNSTARNGLARTTADKIKQAGYKVVAVGNTTKLAKSTVFYRRGEREAALAFQRAFPGFTVLQESTATGKAMLRVVIGSDYP